MIALIISLCSGAIVYAVSVMYAGIGETSQSVQVS